MNRKTTLSSLIVSALLATAPAMAAEEGTTLDLAARVPSAAEVSKDLFPDDECAQLRAAGFKCMGFKAARRYSVPAGSFEAGKSDLTEGLKRYLDVFAEALKGRPANSPKVLISGHTDAKGDPKINQWLSEERASKARDYLVSQGVSRDLLVTEGVGSRQPKPGISPDAPENRRIEVGRAQAAEAH